ncbi:MAG TPA: pentapeptide repeat-containing protein [Thermoanaerobaculia bacterium]|nr:pentapeptide repeat-containing protein [Thermoanaerobaculia bacterium]
MDSTSTEAIDVGGSGLRYYGKYKLAVNINPVHYLTVDKGFNVGGSTSESDAAVFAMYGGDFSVVFQHIPAKATDPGGGFLKLQVNGDYAQGHCIAEPARATAAFISFTGPDTFRLIDYRRDDPREIVATTDGGFRFWLPKPGWQFIDPWRRIPVKVWNDTDMKGADLTFVLLSDRQFDEIDLSEADLRRASLARTTLSGAKLKKVKCDEFTFFSGATLPRCDFTDATLSGTHFEDADLSHCTFGAADLKSAKFSAKTKFLEAKLEGAKFDGNDLSGVDFTKAKLNDASFLSAKLAGAKLVEAELKKAKLNSAAASGAKFTNAKLDGAVLTGATFDAHTDFTGATFLAIDFSGCDLTKAVFSPQPVTWYDATTPVHAILKRVTIPIALLGLKNWSWLDLEGATINGTLPMNLTDFQARSAIFPDDYNLDGRDITNANFTYARMRGVKLNNAEADDEKEPPDFSYADLTKAKMHKVDLKRAKFTYATLRGITMTGGSLLVGADFSYAKLQSEGTDVADLSYAMLMDATFIGATLGSTTGQVNGANFSYAIIFGKGKFDSATLPRAQFTGAYLAGVSFQNIENKSMASALFANACLVNCTFAGTSLASATLNNACLQGADFSAAKLSGAQMSNAAISRQAGTIAIKNFPIPVVTSLPFQPTKIDQVATDESTSCPNGPGPCTGEKWYSPSAPTEWSYAGKAWLGRTIDVKPD